MRPDRVPRTCVATPLCVFSAAILCCRLCCECGAVIPVNPSALCVNCIRTKVDISEGIPKQVRAAVCVQLLPVCLGSDEWVCERFDLRTSSSVHATNFAWDSESGHGQQTLFGQCVRRLRGSWRVTSPPRLDPRLDPPANNHNHPTNPHARRRCSTLPARPACRASRATWRVCYSSYSPRPTRRCLAGGPVLLAVLFCGEELPCCWLLLPHTVHAQRPEAGPLSMI